jgi:hypothetical protein
LPISHIYLLVGYNEDTNQGPKSGSHNLVSAGKSLNAIYAVWDAVELDFNIYISEGTH